MRHRALAPESPRAVGGLNTGGLHTGSRALCVGRGCDDFLEDLRRVPVVSRDEGRRHRALHADATGSLARTDQYHADAPDRWGFRVVRRVEGA